MRVKDIQVGERYAVPAYGGAYYRDKAGMVEVLEKGFPLVTGGPRHGVRAVVLEDIPYSSERAGMELKIESSRVLERWNSYRARLEAQALEREQRREQTVAGLEELARLLEPLKELGLQVQDPRSGVRRGGDQVRAETYGNGKANFIFSLEGFQQLMKHAGLDKSTSPPPAPEETSALAQLLRPQPAESE